MSKTDVDQLLVEAQKAIEKQDRLRALQAQEQWIKLHWGKPINPVSRETRRRLLGLMVRKA